MAKKQMNVLQEKINHMTESKPFSIHRTVFGPDQESVLYLHWHPEFEFFYLAEGTVRFQVEAETFILRAGEAVFLRPYLLHSAHKVNDHGGIDNAFVFSPSFLADAISEQQYERYESAAGGMTGQCDMILFRSQSEWERTVLENLREIVRYRRRPLQGCEFKIRGHFLIIWQELMNHCFRSADNRIFDKYQNQLRPVFNYISEHYNESIQLHQLSDLVFLSCEQFCRVFKKSTGLTPFEYLNRFRIQKSCEYLASSDRKIAEIAILTGFNNISYFNRIFKKYRRLSPGEYRDAAAST